MKSQRKRQHRISIGKTTDFRRNLEEIPVHDRFRRGLDTVWARILVAFLLLVSILHLLPWTVSEFKECGDKIVSVWNETGGNAQPRITGVLQVAEVPAPRLKVRDSNGCNCCGHLKNSRGNHPDLDPKRMDCEQAHAR